VAFDGWDATVCFTGFGMRALVVEMDPGRTLSASSALVKRFHRVRRRFEGIGTRRQLWSHEEAQDIAEYAVMLAVILVIVVGTLRLVGSNSNNVFSSVASSIGQ
jgi:Flp pilus assembly pilin Flp